MVSARTLGNQRTTELYPATENQKVDRMSVLRSVGDVIGFLLLSIYAIIEALVRAMIPSKYKMKSIVGDVALVTGGGGGLGRLIALRLANLGAIVVIWDINKEGMEETVKLVQATGGTCYGYVCDLCNREDVYKKAAIVKEEVGRVTILVNNAGYVTATKFMDTPDELIARTMDVNIMSHFWTAKAFLPSMMENNKGHIVNIASLAGYAGITKLVDYCASKHGAVGFNDALRMELEAEGYNIYTTVVCPYFIGSTGMFEDVQSRFVSILSPNEVAERAVTAMRCNERVAIIPGYIRFMLGLQWFFPRVCMAMFLRGLVLDVSPEKTQKKPVSPTTEKEPSILSKDQNGATIHHQLTRRISSSERKP